MLHVLRHYLPFQKGLLIVSETALITLALMAGMSSHLWSVDQDMRRILANESLDPSQALWLCFFSVLTVSVLVQVVLSFNELYDFRISASPYERAARFLGSAGSAALLAAAIVAVAELWELERLLEFPGLPITQTVVLLTISLGFAFALLYLWRGVFHALMKRTRFTQKLLVLGSGRLAHRTIEEVRARPNSGMEIVAAISPAAPAGGRGRRREDERRGEQAETGNPWFDAGATVAGPRPAGRETRRSGTTGELVYHAVEAPAGPAAAVAPERAQPESRREELTESLSELAARLEVSDIVVALEDRRGSLPTDDLMRCRLDGIVVHESESFFEHLTGKIPAEAMRPSYLIFNRGFLQHPLAQITKRVFDVVFGLVVLFLAWPVMLAAAVAIRLDSPGPILFRQERTGQNGRPFTLCKFRSMRADAEKLTGPVWAQANDPRITRVGGFLRRSRIDELPQIFNVLAGSMSFVGPRPERPAFVEELVETIPYYDQRHIAKPGLTGWAQINYPYGNTVEDALQKLQYDLFYIKFQSLLFDVSIVMNTVKTVLLRKGT
jgi:exopolysaccharide biosynthesis polyprenyl glycosylphosphotransferase